MVFSTIIWFVMILILVLYALLVLPIGLIVSIMLLKDHDREVLRMPSLVAFIALDYVLFGDLTRKYVAPPKWYYPFWRRGWWAKLRHA